MAGNPLLQYLLCLIMLENVGSSGSGGGRESSSCCRGRRSSHTRSSWGEGGVVSTSVLWICSHLPQFPFARFSNCSSYGTMVLWRPRNSMMETPLTTYCGPLLNPSGETERVTHWKQRGHKQRTGDQTEPIVQRGRWPADRQGQVDQELRSLGCDDL